MCNMQAKLISLATNNTGNFVAFTFTRDLRDEL